MKVYEFFNEGLNGLNYSKQIYYSKGDVDKAVKKTEKRISKLFKARLKGLSTEDKAAREFIKFKMGVDDIIKEELK